MRHFRKRQSRFFNRPGGHRGECFDEGGRSRGQGVVSSERRTLRDGIEIAHLILDERFDCSSGFHGKNWVAQGPQQSV